MIQVNWQDQWLDVCRLVFRRGHERGFDATLDSLAARFRLEVADDQTEPHPGDFWIGCHPRIGWGNANPELIGWASLVEVPLALGVLKRTAAEAESRTHTATADGPAFAISFS